MAYVVTLWEGDRPTSEKDAREVRERLADRHQTAESDDAAHPKEPPSRTIADLIRVLLRRWPDLGAPDSEASPWADGPLAENASGPILTLALTPSAVRDALPIIVAEADRRGLACFDEQGPPFLLTPAMLSAMPDRQPGLRQAVSDALVAQGYRRKHGIHVRPIDTDFCSVIDTGAPSRQAATVYPFVGVHHHGVEQLVGAALERPDTTEFVMTTGAIISAILGPSAAGWVDAADESFADEMEATTDVRRASVAEVIAYIAQARSAVDRYARLDRLTAAGEVGCALRPFDRVAVFVLLGDMSSAGRALAEAKRSECQQDDAVCEQFRRFERNLRTHVGREQADLDALDGGARAAVLVDALTPRGRLARLVGRLRSRG